MIRALAILCGLAGGATLCQAPEFTQQYMQRLAGQVDALDQVVRDFDASALAAGLGREEALSQMTGTAFLTARQSDMRATFARHGKLTDDLAALRAASPLARLAMPLQISDRETALATWADFQPALPLSTAGAVAGAGGGVATWALALLTIGGLRRVLTRKPQAPGPRIEPRLTGEGR